MSDREYYECQECGMRYADKAWAEKCEQWCKEHHTCNLEIIQHAVESEDEAKQIADELLVVIKKVSKWWNRWLGFAANQIGWRII